MPYSEFAGKIAVVTGASGGIGKALVKAFVANKLRVAALDANGDGVSNLQKEYDRGVLLALRCDVSDPDDCARQVEATIRHFGGLHILVNNAALGMNAVDRNYDEGQLQIEDVSEDLWRRFHAANVNGPFFLARAVIPTFRRQRWGRIVNVSTSYLTMMRRGFSPYGPTKAALEAWTLMLSRELEDSGITVNAVLPGGPSDTPMVVDAEGLDRSTLIPPAVMAAPMLGLFTEAGGAVTGRRFIAAEWDESLGPDPALQRHRWAAWPELGQTFSKAPSHH